MDANEVDMPGSALQKFINKNDLGDALANKHPNVTPPHTYQRRDNRLDYIFVTPAFLPCITTVCFLPFNAPFLTEHGALYADFEEELMILGMQENPIKQSTCKLVADNPTCRDKYVEILLEYFDHYNICQRVEELYTCVKEDSITARAILEEFELPDRQIMEFILSVEDKCRKGKRRYMWSLKLVSVVCEVCYWKTRKSDALNSRELSNTLLWLGDELAIRFCPITLDKLSAKLTQARKQI
eukprot:10700763-Ditylum_brightwellii.AAC.1